MDAMGEADLIVVTDTGSSDGTAERLRQRGAVVYHEKIDPWRFDTARNISLGHVPDDVDICVCTDLDEVLESGWRESLEKAWTPRTKMGKYLYNWSFKPDGTPDVCFNYFKAHARNAYVWVYPIHECLKYIGSEPEETVFVKGMVLNHFPDASKSRASYLPLLELAVAEDSASDRMAYYLGREYMYHGMWEKCIQTLQRHLALPGSVWAHERCASMRWIAYAYYQLGNIREAFTWYYNAIRQLPDMREPYVECAKMAYDLSDWATVYYMSAAALKIKERSSVYVNMGYAWDHTPYDLGAIAAYRLGMFKKAVTYAKAAADICPHDARLQDNLRICREKYKSTLPAKPKKYS